MIGNRQVSSVCAINSKCETKSSWRFPLQLEKKSKKQNSNTFDRSFCTVELGLFLDRSRLQCFVCHNLSFLAVAITCFRLRCLSVPSLNFCFAVECFVPGWSLKKSLCLPLSVLLLCVVSPPKFAFVPLRSVSREPCALSWTRVLRSKDGVTRCREWCMSTNSNSSWHCSPDKTSHCVLLSLHKCVPLSWTFFSLLVLRM